MRRQFYKYIVVLCVIWLLIVIRLNYMVYNEKSGDPSFRSLDPLLVNINYFKSFYSNSIEDDPNNIYGRNGSPVVIGPEEKNLSDIGFNLHKFNELASSKIGYLRKIPEKRRKSCFSRMYPKTLPTASIIIIYHNEAFSTLARTVHTSLSRAPDHLIKEIILVDDFSDQSRFPHLFEPLDSHFANITKVRIIRMQKRVGLTVARLVGARAASGDVLVFLDSHCESFEGYLEPLLLSIKQHPQAAITPIIEVIDMNDFSISPNKLYQINVGIFTWKGDFTWHIPENQDSSSNLIKSPTMAGGLFAIGREFFFEIGAYDEGMQYWGSENMEISLRLWMCAGGIYVDPCSIIAHVFRTISPHDLRADAVLNNKMRFVEVWTDDYKSQFYSRMGVSQYDEKAGPLDDRINLRKKLKCRSFEWYLKNIATEVKIPGKATSIRNPETDLCIDSANNRVSNKPVRVIKCHNSGGNQAIEVNRDGTIVFEEFCLDLSMSRSSSRPTFYKCHFSGGNQKWEFLENKLIRSYNYQLCLKVDKSSGFLLADTCDESDSLQIFEYSFSN